MADHVAMFRRGEISARQAGKLGILKQTRVNRPNEEDFDGKQGRGDQGGADWKRPFDIGDKAADTEHINRNQRKTAAGVSGPSRGGGAGREKQIIHKNQIDDAGTQKPDFPGGKRAALAKPAVRSTPPGGGKPAMRMAKAPPTPKKARGNIPPQGGQYGGGGRNTQ